MLLEQAAFRPTPRFSFAPVPARAEEPFPSGTVADPPRMGERTRPALAILPCGPPLLRRLATLLMGKGRSRQTPATSSPPPVRARRRLPAPLRPYRLPPPWARSVSALRSAPSSDGHQRSAAAFFKSGECMRPPMRNVALPIACAVLRRFRSARERHFAFDLIKQTYCFGAAAAFSRAAAPTWMLRRHKSRLHRLQYLNAVSPTISRSPIPTSSARQWTSAQIC